MIRLSAIKLPPGHTKEELIRKTASRIGQKAEDLTEFRIIRRSIEARKKEKLCYVYTVLVAVKDERSVRSYLRSRSGKTFEKKHSIIFQDPLEIYHFPSENNRNDCLNSPVIIGSGPAGLLCAYELALNGYAPIVLERGLPVEERIRKVEHFWKTNELDPECNVQFGEGGAGTFSDGKLSTGVTDRSHRLDEVLNLFVSCGAPEEILYDALPHIGSDILYEMIPRVREKIQELGGTFQFGTKAEDLIIENGRIAGVLCSDGIEIPAEAVILATGHSARDTFKMLYEHGVVMAPKAFAVGVRCEHDQEMINRNQWGPDYPKSFGAAPYKLTHKTTEGRSVYTFCMCPGGFVVNASSEENGLAVNGMSLSKRDSGRANSAVIVSVTPEDYQEYISEATPCELSGAAFQRDLEEKAFQAGGGYIPVSRYGDFKAGTVSSSDEEIEGCHKGLIHAADLHDILPDYICRSLEEGIEAFDKKIPGFSADDTLLYAVESRTSSPVRILRDETFQSNLKGLFPCGEGAGYAGGIMSAAMDGIKVAEAVAKYLTEEKR